MKLITIRTGIASIILVGLFILKSNPYIVTVFIALTAFLYNRKTVYPLKNIKFWFVILLLVILVPIFTGFQDNSFLGVNYSSDQLQKTIFMALRGLSIFLLFQVLTIDLNIEKIKPIFSTLRIQNFDILYNLSSDFLPKIKKILNARYNLFKINWKKQHSIEIILSFMTDIFTDFIRLIDNVSSSKTNMPAVTPDFFYNSYNITNCASLIIIVGDPNSGKTTWVEQFVKLLRSNNHSVDGIISKKVLESEDKCHHNILRLKNNESVQLTSTTKIDPSIQIGNYFIFEDSIEWANQQLKSIIKTEWIIVDEIGLLEFNSDGFLDGLTSILQDFQGHLVLTLRTILYDQLDEFIDNKLPSLKDWSKEIIILN